MAKRKATGARRSVSSPKKTSAARKKTSAVKKKSSARKTAAKSTGGGRPKARKALKKAAKPARASALRRKAAARKSPSKQASSRSKRAGATRKASKAPRAQKKRRPEQRMVPTPPSSLDMNRRGSAARTGRDEMAEERADHANMTPSITGGDVDANVEDAYFTGDEAPGGDNSTPDQDIVDDIGRALGVEYQDNEELRASDKVAARDKHRWELDPASSEDYRDRK